MTLSVLCYPGNKARLASEIVPYLASHICYVDVFGGAAGLLLNKPQSKGEVYNDIDSELVNFFKMLQNDTEFKSFLTDQFLTPYSRYFYEKAFDESKTNLDYWIKNRMGFGGLTIWKSFGISRGDPIATKYGNKFGDLLKTALRLKQVCIENLQFDKVIEVYDAEGTLFYCDPPYMERTDMYAHGKDGFEHIKLKRILDNIEGKFLLSYFDSDEVRDLYSGYHFRTFTRNKTLNSNQATGIHTELLIANYPIDKEIITLDSSQSPLSHWMSKDVIA